MEMKGCHDIQSAMTRKVVDGVLRGRGSLPKEAGMLCFEEISLSGGRYVWQTILAAAARCMASEALSVEQVVVLNFDSETEMLHGLLRSDRYALTVLDGYLDPEGWMDRALLPTLPHTTQLIHLHSLDSIAESVLSRMATKKGAVVIDSLTSLLFRHDRGSVLKLLMQLKAHPNCCSVVVRYYTEGRSHEEVEFVRSVCTGRLQQTAVNETMFPLAETVPHGALTSFQTTETGRFLSQTEWYRVDASGVVWFFPALDASNVDSAKLVAAHVNKKANSDGQREGALEQTLMQQMEGGMKLTLTKQEKQAKGEVILPYEKVTDASHLGEIHYVRDSEEEYDSDEDPDDDLDI